MRTALRIVFALLLTAALTEGGMRAYRAAIGQTPPHPDPSLAAEWDWARERLDAGTPSLGSRARHDPLLGWRARRRTRPAAGGPREVGVARTPGVPRVVLVGDSFTRELGRFRLPFEGDRTFQPGWEVVNLGVQGYGAGQAWLRYREDGGAYHGDVAVFGFYLRDYFRTFRRFRSYAKPTFSLVEGRLRVGDVPVPTPEALLAAYRSGERRIGRPGRSWALDFVRQQTAERNRESDLREERFAVFRALLAGFRDDARRDGACPLLVIFPTRPEDYAGTVYETLDHRTREAAAGLELPWLALADAMYAGASPAEAARSFGEGSGAHMSEDGRRAVFRALDAAFEGLTPPACFETRPDGSVGPRSAATQNGVESAG
jgi:hypothetical protein